MRTSSSAPRICPIHFSSPSLYFSYASHSGSSTSGRSPLAHAPLPLSVLTVFAVFDLGRHTGHFPKCPVFMSITPLFYWPEDLRGFLPSFLEDRG